MPSEKTERATGEPTGNGTRSETRAHLAKASIHLRGIDRSTLDRHDPDIHRAILAVGEIFNAVRLLADTLEGN